MHAHARLSRQLCTVAGASPLEACAHAAGYAVPAAQTAHSGQSEPAAARLTRLRPSPHPLQSTELLGKPQGQDLASGNLTAPAIYALQVRS